MPKSKDPNTYNFAYWDLFQHLGKKETSEVKLNFSTKKEAEKIRFDLYGFKGALVSSGDELAFIGNQTIMVIEKDLTKGYNLILRKSIDNDVNNLILSAISTESLSGKEKEVRDREIPVNPLDLEPVEEVEDTNEQAVYKQYMHLGTEGRGKGEGGKGRIKKDKEG